MTKEEFVSKYNPRMSSESALRSAFNASIKRNKLYKQNLTKCQKEEIKIFWGEKLKEIASKTEKLADVNNYNFEITQLKFDMMNIYSELIDFRISHSQKSISIYFKYLWCIGRIQTPPVSR